MLMKKIIVLGSTGMLGHMVLKVLTRNKEWDIQGASSKDFNVEQFTETESPLQRRLGLLTSNDYIINCIGVLTGDDEEKMKKVNAEFPHQLAKSTSAKIIHMSTDGVFSGHHSPSPPPLTPPTGGGDFSPGSSPLMGEVRRGWQETYNEDSPCDAMDVYGRTKSLGEVYAPNVINIRTSIIGPSPYKKKGLLEWFLAQPEGATVRGFTNHIWNGVTTLQFAQLCEKIIREEAFGSLREESSVFHFAPNKPLTKYELLALFKEVFEKNVNVEPTEDPRGKVERVLNTKYEGLKKLFPHDMRMEEALKQLSQFSPP